MEKKKTSLWAVICGNIRDELEFKLTLTRIVKLRSELKVDHIVFSTWNGEIDKYNGLREQLKSLKIYVLEGEAMTKEIESTPSNSVNYWRQARQLLSALDIIPKTDFVLRLRTDRSLNYINYMDKQDIFSNYKHKVKTFGNFPKLLNYQIIVFRPRTVRLFQMTDFVLLGQNKDLYKLINFDFYDLHIQKPVVANIQWFAYPFLKEFPVLRDYLRFTRYTQMVPVLRDYVDKKQEDSVFPEIYYKVYAVYLLTLYTHFYIISPEKINQNNRNEVGFHHFFSSSKSKGLKYQSLGTIILDRDLIKMAITGNLLKTPSYDKFMDYVERAMHNDEDDDIFEMNHEEYRQVVDFYNGNNFECESNMVWLKKINRHPLNIKKLNHYSEADCEVDLNCLSISNEEWEKLTYTDLIERDLFKIWKNKSDVTFQASEKMLLPIARTGNECAIFILIDMLYNDFIQDINYNEVVRISLFYLNTRLGNNNITNITISIVLILVKLHFLGKIELKRFEDIAVIILSKIMSKEAVDYIISVDKVDVISFIADQIKKTVRDVHLRELFCAVLMNKELSQHVIETLKGDELVIAKKKCSVMKMSMENETTNL